MAIKKIKKAYDYPENLMNEWMEYHNSKGSKNYSPSAAGAMLVFLALPAELREIAMREANNPNVDQAITVISEAIQYGFSQQRVQYNMKNFEEVDPEAIRLLNQLMQHVSGKGASGKNPQESEDSK